MFIRFLIFILIAITACTPQKAEAPTVIIQPTPEWVDFEAQDIQLHLKKPDGWFSYVEEGRLTLTEHEQILADSGELTGLVVNIWIKSTTDFAIADENGENDAWAVLEAVTHAPHLVGDMSVTDPKPFTWAGHDAAYYMMSDKHGSVSLVLVLLPHGSDKIIACRINAPAQESKRIRILLPALMEGITINGAQLDASALNGLPDPLHYPAYENKSWKSGR